MTTDLHEGLESTLNLLAKEYRNRIIIHRDYGNLPRVECYPGQINQVFMNLLQNAAQAIPNRGDSYSRSLALYLIYKQFLSKIERYLIKNIFINQ